MNSRLAAILIEGQRKAFYRQIIPGSSCAGKETFDIDILVISRNGDRKIMQSIRTMSRLLSRIRKLGQLSQFDEHQINTYRKGLKVIVCMVWWVGQWLQYLIMILVILLYKQIFSKISRGWCMKKDNICQRETLYARSFWRSAFTKLLWWILQITRNT